VAVVEYRLMDLALFGRRALALAATLSMSLLLFLGLVSVTELLVPPFVDPPGLVPILIAAVVTAALAPVIRAGSRDLIGRIYYRRRYSFRRALARVARELNAEQELSRLARVFEQKIGEALNASPVRLLLVAGSESLVDPVSREPVEGRLPATMAARLEQGRIVALADVASAPVDLPLLHRTDVQILVPLRLRGRLIAILAVGPRSTGGLLDSDDLDLLASVAAHASAAVAGAQSLDQLREQVQLVERLRTRTEALIDGSPIGMAVVDPEGVVRHWNPSIEKLLGKSRGEVLGQDYRDALPVTLQLIFQQALHAESDSGNVRAYRVRVSVPGEQERLLNVSASRLSGDEGDEGLLLSLDDVTEQARLEEKLIQQDRLASVGLLAAGVAHEVNTPLTGISSYAQILLEEIDRDDPRGPMLEKIIAQAQRASRIARGLLTLSRPGAREQMSLGPVDLSDLCEETLGLIAPQIRKAGARVETRWSSAPPVAEADRSRLQQVLMNLLLNAVDAIEKGGRIVVRTGTDAHGRPCFEVQDDGHGIPADARDRIFDPFFTTKGPGRSTGLGLSISYAIVREHGGTLSVDSREGRGTLMRVVLPEALPVPARRMAV
jgi:PAS domain S-box-containing protein